jgi:hypothetical protein
LAFGSLGAGEHRESSEEVARIRTLGRALGPSVAVALSPSGILMLAASVAVIAAITFFL